MAKAKRTARAEARRRTRHDAADAAAIERDDAELIDDDAPAGRPSGDRGRQQPPAERRDPNARLGFGEAFRVAYRPARVREDLVLLPKLLTSRAFILAALLVFAGAGLFGAFPRYDGSVFAFELLVWPGSAIAPQLLAGFLAPRASYLLGFVVGLLQGATFSILINLFPELFGATIPPDQMSNLLFLSFISGPFGGMLFAASAAWYRRFLALTSRRPANRPSGRGGGQRRSSRR